MADKEERTWLNMQRHGQPVFSVRETQKSPTNRAAILSLLQEGSPSLSNTPTHSAGYKGQSIDEKSARWFEREEMLRSLESTGDPVLKMLSNQLRYDDERMLLDSKGNQRPDVYATERYNPHAATNKPLHRNLISQSETRDKDRAQPSLAGWIRSVLD